MNRFEIKYGIGNRKLLMVIPLIAIFFIFLSQYISYLDALNNGVMLPKTVQYHLGKILYGTTPAVSYLAKKSRELPIEWLTIQIGFNLVIMGFAHDEVVGKTQSLVRYGTYKKWWQNRVKWVACMLCGYYFVVGLILVATVYIERITIAPINAEMITSSYGCFLLKAYAVTLVLFIARSFLFGIIQLIIEVIFSPLLGLCVSMGFLIVEVLSENQNLPGQLAMLSKNAVIIENDLRLAIVLAIYFFVTTALICIGGRICRNANR